MPGGCTLLWVMYTGKPMSSKSFPIAAAIVGMLNTRATLARPGLACSSVRSRAMSVGYTSRTGTNMTCVGGVADAGRRGGVWALLCAPDRTGCRRSSGSLRHGLLGVDGFRGMGGLAGGMGPLAPAGRPSGLALTGLGSCACHAPATVHAPLSTLVHQVGPGEGSGRVLHNAATPAPPSMSVYQHTAAHAMARSARTALRQTHTDGWGPAVASRPLRRHGS
mmetsp:Transcript_118428/g.206112  ORF Transcript_118428/g.206112 Transcript_118428/m.206112 type:complete len:221 (-) Transcript_118428:37-699(-)